MAHESNKPMPPGGREAAPGQTAPTPQPRKRPESETNEQMDAPEQNRKLGKRHD